MAVAAEQCRLWIEATWPGTPVSRFACRNTSSGGISQHSAYGSPSAPNDSNAIDVFGPDKTDGPADQAWVQAIVDTIRADGEHKWSIRKILWLDGGAHENHAHIDFYPMITVKKWCGASWTPSWKYQDGTTISTRDPMPQNGLYDGSGAQPVPPPTNPGGSKVYLPLVYSDGFSSNPARAEDVRWLQLALSAAGFDIGPDGVDGKYGNDTASAVSSMMGGGDGRTYAHQEHQALLQLTGSGGGPVAPHAHDFSGTTGLA